MFIIICMISDGIIQLIMMRMRRDVFNMRIKLKVN